VLNLVHELEQKSASLKVLEPEIDTGAPMGRMVLMVLGMVAEMELGFIRDRQRAGIDAEGVYKGPHLPSTAPASLWVGAMSLDRD
jgi:DNA invertase Pin-like site-specific DNA recombinase